MNDKTRPMGDGSVFNAESGEPRKTLFGVEARFFDKQSGKAEQYLEYILW